MIDSWLLEEYFRFLKKETFVLKSYQRDYEQVLRILHDIPFYWLIQSDCNRVGDAMAYRQSEFLDGVDTRQMDTHALRVWALSSPSVLEAMLGMAHRWSFYFGGPSVAYYFTEMFANMGFLMYKNSEFPQKHDELRTAVDIWLSRNFDENGNGSPFPLKGPHVNQRYVDMWGQMNAYSLEHFQ